MTINLYARRVWTTDARQLIVDAADYRPAWPGGAWCLPTVPEPDGSANSAFAMLAYRT